MTEAQLEPVPPDPREARVFVGQAKVFLRDGGDTALADSSRQVLLHNAAVAASDAVLLAAGWRVTGGDGAHARRLEKAVELLGADDDLAEGLEDARLTRNEVSYAAQVPALDDVARAHDVTGRLVDLADGFVKAASRDA